MWVKLGPSPPRIEFPGKGVALPPERFYILFGSRRRCPELSRGEESLRFLQTRRMATFTKPNVLYSTFPRSNSIHDIQKQTWPVATNFLFPRPLGEVLPSEDAPSLGAPAPFLQADPRSHWCHRTQRGRKCKVSEVATRLAFSSRTERSQ